MTFKLQTRKVNAFFKWLKKNKNVVQSYNRYLVSITPKSLIGYYRRWIFAFLSPRTSWPITVNTYLDLDELFKENYGYLPNIPSEFLDPVPQVNNQARPKAANLIQCLTNNRIGMHNVRHKYITMFDAQFRLNPYELYPNFSRGETIRTCRDRLVKKIHGLGMAKVSFALEMIFPFATDILCLDSHMIKAYGFWSGTPTYSQYRKMEDHWCKRCKEIGVASPVARHIFWDRMQGFSDPRYWTFVFEKKRPKLPKSREHRLIGVS